ncbi:DUF3466 family protein [Vibrio cincinnatiensis]|uniref:DUF3466 family protein n=1 Tax=Vibrio cincinnatiensis TaxID=675 RepID=UPI001EDF777E|nr:DUF3466 family protein [Vibrio cincinnatiensis]MCG3729006.1 DUF3466 family protein [Vibrio cincinnatiensis]
MSSNTFKRTLVSAAILASTSASAALYEVVEVTHPGNYLFKSSYGVAIQPGMVNEPLGCFNASTTPTQCEFLLAGETRLVEAHAGEAVDGLSYREEVPFRLDNSFAYVQDNSDFKNYCRNELGYSICDTWASIRWNLWDKEINGDTTPNAIAFIEDKGARAASVIDVANNVNNVVINSLTEDEQPVGIVSALGDRTGYRRNSVTAFVGTDDYTVNGSLQTRAWKTDGTYTVGSIATENTNSQGDYYTSKGTIWKNSTVAIQVPWGAGVAAKRNQLLAQGSLRDFVISDDGDSLYAVGFNTFYEKYHYMQASVSLLTINDDDSLNHKKTVEVKGATVYSGGGTSGDKLHTNSILTSVNENLIAIGEAKRASSKQGAYANRLFIVPNVAAEPPTAAFLSGGIFFEGAGGKAGAINNYNEMVGQIDADNTREVNGKPRRKRGFIYPYDDDNNKTELTRREIFNNQAWWLDDLTNGGKHSTDNNQYRIIDATDINDAGVIAATAFKCDGGYDSTAHNATCGNGTREESTVAVKLIPIAGATSDNIVRRGMDERATERKGAAVGLWALVLLGLFGFRRK